MSDGITRRGLLRWGTVGLVGSAAVATTRPASAGPVDRAARRGLLAEVRAAAREHGVPVAVLLAMGYVNTRLEMPAPAAADYRRGDPEGRGAYGMMSLVRNPWEDTVAVAARLTGLSAQALVADRAANLRGGAALLAYSQGRHRPELPRDWMPAVAGHGGTGPRLRATAGIGAGDDFAEQVGQALRDGFAHRTRAGEHVVLPGGGA